MDWPGWTQVTLVWGLAIVVGIVISSNDHHTKPK